MKEDVPALAALEREHPGYPAWGETGLLAEFGKNFSVTLVAEPAGRPAGFVNFWLLKPQVQLNAVVVSASALRGGVAWALLGKLYEYARKSGCGEIDLEVNANNGPALRLYEKAGFTVAGRRPKYYNNTDDAVLMRKELTPR